MLGVWYELSKSYVPTNAQNNVYRLLHFEKIMYDTGNFEVINHRNILFRR